MAEVAVIGNSEFTLGFSLIGIKNTHTVETSQETKEAFSTAMDDVSIGLIITNDTTIDRLDITTKRQVENSQNPVVVSLSMETGAQENLREMIKKAIGVDLWSK